MVFRYPLGLVVLGAGTVLGRDDPLLLSQAGWTESCLAAGLIMTDDFYDVTTLCVSPGAWAGAMASIKQCSLLVCTAMDRTGRTSH
jgi:hypothetical protein